jgi:hypothetical protein
MKEELLPDKRGELELQNDKWELMGIGIDWRVWTTECFLTGGVVKLCCIVPCGIDIHPD